MKGFPFREADSWNVTGSFVYYSRPGAYLTFRAGGTFEITRWILGWGDAAEVVRPAGLRNNIAAILKAAASFYWA